MELKNLDTLNPEMIAVVTLIKEAQQKDEAEYQNWVTARAKTKDTWEKMTSKLKEQAIREGRAFNENVKPPMRKWTRTIRRQLRYKLFRLREGKWQSDAELAALKSWYDSQFQSGWTWKDFTFKWDLSAIDPLKIVTPIEWDGDVVAEKTAGGSLGKFCDPAAFTHQEM